MLLQLLLLKLLLCCCCCKEDFAGPRAGIAVPSVASEPHLTETFRLCRFRHPICGYETTNMLFDGCGQRRLRRSASNIVGRYITSHYPAGGSIGACDVPSTGFHEIRLLNYPHRVLYVFRSRSKTKHVKNERTRQFTAARDLPLPLTSLPRRPPCLLFHSPPRPPSPKSRRCRWSCC